MRTGVLRLANELEVKVVDAAFAPSEALPLPTDPDNYAPLTLTKVLLTLVDERERAVGRPSW